MHKLTYFPLGNADCCRIDLDNGQRLLFDFSSPQDTVDGEDRRIDLPEELRGDLQREGRDSYDVVAFTHLDRDHFGGASDFFFLEHAKKYQGEERVRIDELWVPAAVIVEEELDDEEARIIQTEARYRLREGKGIRVFSRPEALKEWLASEGLSVEERAQLITDAGQLVPGFTTSECGVEFFVHSPFASNLEDGSTVDRNRESIVVQLTFFSEGRSTRVILGSDLDHESLAEIVRITRDKGNQSRLEWDVFKVPHHCSYLSIGPDKGKDKTMPVEEVKWLYEEQGQERGIAISSSKPIPSTDEIQPPHRQAAAYYRDVLKTLEGELIVTMEHPSISEPDRLEISIGSPGAAVLKQVTAPYYIASGRKAHRAGDR